MRLRVALVVTSLLLLGACEGSTAPASAPVSTTGVRHVVVDTDLGPDDVMALLFLLRRTDVVVDAVTVDGDGLTHCDPGVANARALLASAGAPDTPVACGRETPLEGVRGFPPQWRTFADDLSSLGLPAPAGEPTGGTAADLLRTSLTGDVALLTLGPFTNVAEALRADPSLAERIGQVTSMAGAFDVPGNGPGGYAEYNAWVDPVATAEVLAALPVRLVPLDATDSVPITPTFLHVLSTHATTPESKAVATLLETNPQVLSGASFFWDPLAAALLVDPSIGTTERTAVAVGPPDDRPGATARADRGTVLTVMTAADPIAFERAFLSALTGRAIVDVRPAPDVAVRFDGTTCDVEGRTRLPAGGVLLGFEDAADAPASVAVGTLRGTTFRALVAALGEPGTRITENPKGFTPLGAATIAPGTSTVLLVVLPPGRAVIGCSVQRGRSVSVWPGAELRIR